MIFFSTQVHADHVRREPSMTKFTRSANLWVPSEIYIYPALKSAPVFWSHVSVKTQKNHSSPVVITLSFSKGVPNRMIRSWPREMQPLTSSVTLDRLMTLNLQKDLVGHDSAPIMYLCSYFHCRPTFISCHFASAPPEQAWPLVLSVITSVVFGLTIVIIVVTLKIHQKRKTRKIATSKKPIIVNPTGNHCCTSYKSWKDKPNHVTWMSHYAEHLSDNHSVKVFNLPCFFSFFRWPSDINCNWVQFPWGPARAGEQLRVTRLQGLLRAAHWMTTLKHLWRFHWIWWKGKERKKNKQKTRISGIR